MSDESRNLAAKLVFGFVPVDLKYLKTALANTGRILVYEFFFHSDFYSYSHPPPSLQLSYIHLRMLILCFIRYI